MSRLNTARKNNHNNYWFVCRSSRLSGAVRQALALCGELDEDDPYYRARRTATSPLKYYDDNDDDNDDDEYVIVLQRRRKRQQSGKQGRDKSTGRSLSRGRSSAINEEDQGAIRKHRSQNHDYNNDTRAFDYTMPVNKRWVVFY